MLYYLSCKQLLAQIVLFLKEIPILATFVKKNQFLRHFFVFSIIGAILLTPYFVIPAHAETREELEAELAKVEAQIKDYEGQLTTTSKEKKTLATKISALKTEQTKLKLEIRATDIKIKQLKDKLNQTVDSIDQTNKKIEDSQAQMTATMRLLYEKEQVPIVQVLATENSLAEFFMQMDDYNRLSDGLKSSLSRVKDLKTTLQSQEVSLEDKKSEAQNLLSIKTLQQKAAISKLGEQSTLLTQTQGKEDAYKVLLADSKKRAADIRNRIYELLGVGTQITFGKAVDIAQWVSSRTGVDAALLLAVLTQESNLGKNVGTCNRPGDPPSKGWKQVMKPTRDQEPFLVITTALGRDPNTTPVSCPMQDSSGGTFGWGGAMGPAQFIPSTWVLYQDRVSAITGKAADPWDIRDAFIASALLLEDNGAQPGNTDSYWTAAMKYFSGSTNPRFRFYGDNVVALATKYQGDINTLANGG